MNVILIAAISADGKIAQATEQNSLDWTSKEDTRFFIDKTKEIGTLVMGRKTFQTIGKPLPGRRIIVLTRNIEAAPDMEGVEYASETPEELVKRLEEEDVESLVIAGGSSIYSQFLQAGLVNELYLTVEPVLFGGGVPLAEGFDRIEMELVDSTGLGERAVLLHYKII